MNKRYGVNHPPTSPRPTNLVEPPILAVVKEDGTMVTFPKVTPKQVRRSLEEKYKVRKRHDIKELVANTDPAFLKDVWEEGDAECYKCASETKYGCKVVCTCKPEPEVTQFDKAEALDRIHVIQTMLSELLGFDGDMCRHKGLSHDAEWLVSEAMEKLCEAYQRQAASWEWGEDVSENQNQGLYVFEEKDDAS